MQDVLLGLDCLGIYAIKILFHEALYLLKGQHSLKNVAKWGETVKPGCQER